MDSPHEAEGTGRDQIALAGDVLLADSADESLGPRLAWRTAAVLYWVAGGGALLQASTGLLSSELSSQSGAYALCALAIALGFVWWAFGSLEVSGGWLHIGVLIAYAILTLMFVNAPSVESQLGIVYLMPLIFVALFMPSRSLFFYVALSTALILQASLRHLGDPFGLIPGIVAIVVLTMTAGLTLYVRLELIRIERQAATLSGRDALTGLANLRPLYERVERGIHDHERGLSGLTVIMLDLEGFKRVNDEYSHSVGDETLRVVARAISDTVRRDELVARRGGDEFAIVTTATDPDDINTLIRRVSHNISDARVDMLPGGRSGVTVGVASCVEGDTVGRLLARADHELHDAKARAKIERWSWRRRRLQDIADRIDEDER